MIFCDVILSITIVGTKRKLKVELQGTFLLVELMKKDKVEPDIKTFDQLLRLIPNTKENELELLEIMEDCNVKPDVSFCNQVENQK